MTQKLGMFSEWAHKNGLGVDPSKIELVLVIRKCQRPSLKLHKLLGEFLFLNSSVKYLGIPLDRKQDWKLNTVDNAT